MTEAAATNDVTGRDAYLITQALSIAIAAIEQARGPWKPLSNADDMRELFDHLAQSPTVAEAYMNEAREIVSARAPILRVVK